MIGFKDKSCKLIGLIFAVMLLISCTPGIKKNLGLDEFKLSDHIQFNAILPVKEALIARAFIDGAENDTKIRTSMDKFPSQEEEVAQEALSNDKEGLATTWKNVFYGEITFHPGRHLKHGGWSCREFKATWITTGVGVYVNKEYGTACLNPKNKRWEWVLI
jgi:surface antigen